MDASRVNQFLSCPESYRLKYQENLVKVQDEAIDAPRQFGQAIHAALQAKYRGLSEQEQNAAFLTVYPDALDPEDLARTPTNGIALLDAYRRYYLLPDQDMKTLSVEVVDQFDIGAAEPWQVKIDLVVETPGGIYGMDHKTTAKALTERYWRQFEPNSQLTGYIAYLTQKYGQCSGCWVNGIALGYRQRAYKGEAAGFHWQFQRQLFNRTQRQIDDWKLRMQRSIARIHATVDWEKNEQQCTYCPYRELCLSCGDEQVRETLYSQVDDPLAYLTS